MSKLKKCLYLIDLLSRRGPMSLKHYHQYGQDDSLYNYLLSAYPSLHWNEWTISS